MTQKLDTLQAALEAGLGDAIQSIRRERGEITLTVAAERYLEVARVLHEHPALKFEQLMDLCGVDYSGYKNMPWGGARYGVVSHLLSLAHNWRVRLKVFAPDDDMPVVASLCDIWASSNWFEREAFDLYGIIFDGHLDLRRILTDYGFIGHPMRKDFPTTGHVEMRYDAQTQRVIYQPVTIEPREITPRVVREDNYGGLQ
jgi:NADH-quinone oxidoreductase subunit C